MKAIHDSIFLWGTFGSLLPDIWTFVKPAREGRVLPRYAKPVTYLGIAILAIAAGGLAVALAAPSPQNALVIGASLPVFVRSPKRTLK